MNSSVNKLPSTTEVEQAKETSRVLARFSNQQLRIKVLDQDSNCEDIILPKFALQMLLDVLAQMSKGNAVSILPVHAELTTQDAANILNVSRPFLVGLLKDGAIPYKKVGTHRRILAKDLFDYKAKDDQQRLDALKELTSDAQELNLGY